MQGIVIVLLVTLLLAAGAAVIWSKQNQQFKALEQEHQQLQKHVEDLSKVAAVAGGISNQEVKELGTRKALLTRLEQERTLKPEQLEDIYALSVPNITIGKMEIKDAGELTLSAYTSSQGKFIAFVEKLQAQDYIKEIQRISSKRNDKTGEISFTLTLAWEVDNK